MNKKAKENLQKVVGAGMKEERRLFEKLPKAQTRTERIALLNVKDRADDISN